MDINWDGVGAPPVGAICEVHAFHILEGDWIEVKVLAIGLHEKDVAVLVAEHNSGVVGKMHCLLYTRFEDHFRPIKTKEQLAEEGREKSIREIEDVISSIVSLETRRQAAEALHAAGYRKQESNDAKA